jgi:hypothetical protein
MTDLDYNESYEFLASRFYDETGYMAPGKSVAPQMAYTEEQEEERRLKWGAFMSDRSREAWVLWHKAHGYLRPKSEDQTND